MGSRIDITFRARSPPQVNLYLGVWGGRRGKIWGRRAAGAGRLVNVVRRDGRRYGHQRRWPDSSTKKGRDFQDAETPSLA